MYKMSKASENLSLKKTDNESFLGNVKLKMVSTGGAVVVVVVGAAVVVVVVFYYLDKISKNA